MTQNETHTFILDWKIHVLILYYKTTLYLFYTTYNKLMLIS